MVTGNIKLIETVVLYHVLYFGMFSEIMILNVSIILCTVMALCSPTCS